MLMDKTLANDLYLICLLNILQCVVYSSVPFEQSFEKLAPFHYRPALLKHLLVKNCADLFFQLTVESYQLL